MMKTGRREFTKLLGMLGLSGMIAGCSSENRKPTGRASGGAQGTNEKSGLRRLGKTDLFLSAVGFGAQRTKDPDLIRYALDQGMNHIETAWGYGCGLPGNNCECVGKAIAGKRESVCLAVAYEAGAPPESKAWLPNQFEQTLRDLRTDRIDVFLWHHPEITANNREWTMQENQAVVSSGERIDLMLKWKAEGKIRWCGITTHANQPEWLKFMVESELYDVAVVAFNYKSPKRVAQAMQEASQKGIGLIAMKTQSPDYLDAQGTIGTAPDHSKALDWVLSKDFIAAAIPGMTTRDQVDLNLKVMRAVS